MFVCLDCKKQKEKGVSSEYFLFIEDQKEREGEKGFICLECVAKQMQIKTLYHISRHMLNPIEEFIPRIPENRAEGEDKSTKRICLSSSIDGCLSAAPFGGTVLESSMYAEKESFLFRVYEFSVEEMDTEKLIPPQYLYEKGLVHDAELTNEFWYLDTLKPTKSYLIEISYYDEEYPDLIKCKDLISCIKGDLSCEETSDGHITLIYNTKFLVVDERERSKILEINKEVEAFVKEASEKEDIFLIEEIKRKGLEKKEEMREVATLIEETIDHTFFSPGINYIEIVEEENKLYIKGKIDTREYEFRKSNFYKNFFDITNTMSFCFDL